MLKDEGLEVPKGLQPEPRTGISTPTLPPHTCLSDHPEELSDSLQRIATKLGK